MIRVQINQEERDLLQRFRGQSSSKNSEKALMVLLNADGESAVRISGKLSRNPHTVRFWLKRYLAEGLQRKKTSGRPSNKRKECIQAIKEILLKTSHKLEVSEDTLTRGLKDLGYSYKRPSKTASPKAPSSEEKKEAVKTIIESIGKLLTEKPCEVFALDESHFSTEPYLVRGWFKKRWPPQYPEFQQKRKLHHVWMLKFKQAAFLLEAIQTG